MKKNYYQGMGLKMLSSLFLFLCCTFAMAQGTFEITMGFSAATCEVSSDGTAYVESQTGGVEPLTYAWEDGQDFVVAYNLPAGSYSVTVTDANGATAIGTVTVELSPESVWLMPVTSPGSCGECNGTMDPMAMLGLPPYTYAWSDGQTGAIATGLCPGTYTVTVTDSQGCANSATGVVGEIDGEDCDPPCEVEAGTASTNDPTTICVMNGVSDPIAVAIEGASDGDERWLITDENGLILATPPGPNFDLEGAGPGTCNIYYMVYDGDVTGADIGGTIDAIEGCYDLSNAITVIRNGVPDAAILTTDDPTSVCVGDGEADMINVSAEGASGDEMAWVITDENGNILALPAEPPFDFEGAPAGICNIYHFTWLSDLGLEGLTEGSNIADLVGCYAASEAIAVTRTDLNASLNVTEISACGADDGALTVEGASADATYAWSNGATGASIDGLDEGTFTVTITDGACEQTLTVTLIDEGVDIGDYVWYDNNENCKQDHYESGVAFVPVYLYSLGPDGVACTDDDVLEATTGTDGDGYYLFECVDAGTYYIEFHATAVEPDYEYTCQNGAGDADDSDANQDGKTDPFSFGSLGPDIPHIDAGINPICNDVNWGGMICCDQTICAGEIPNVIESVTPAGGGGANPIEYLWLCASTPENPGNPANWTPIPNSNSADYAPGPVYQTKYYVRCARRGDCDDFLVESNTVAIQVVSCGQMLDFQAVVTSNKEVDIEWAIDGDTNANTYYVERSADGIHFEVIDIIEGLDAQDVISSYTLTDVAPKVGRSYYRVKQVEETGNYTYSQVVELLIRLTAEQTFSIYPNPAREVLNIENIEAFETPVTVDFMTTMGKILETVSFPAGTFKQEQISLNSLPSGTYFVRIVYGDTDVEMLKVSKLEE